MNGRKIMFTPVEVNTIAFNASEDMPMLEVTMEDPETGHALVYLMNSTMARSVAANLLAHAERLDA